VGNQIGKVVPSSAVDEYIRHITENDHQQRQGGTVSTRPNESDQHHQPVSGSSETKLQTPSNNLELPNCLQCRHTNTLC